jgi:hypothetical protein
MYLLQNITFHLTHREFNFDSLLKESAFLCITKINNITHQESKSAVYNCTRGQDVRSPDVTEKHTPGPDQKKM